MRSTTRARRRGERAVATIELMLLVPIAFLVMLGVIQVVLVALANSRASDAALAAARADALGHDPGAAAAAALGDVASLSSVQELDSGHWRVDARVVSVFPVARVHVDDEARLPDPLASAAR